MTKVKKQTVRSDTSQTKPKSKQRSEDYLKYQRYIRSSKEFKEVKQIVLERDGYKCMTCGRTKEEANLTCHHRSYEHLFEGGETEAADCICLCQFCHSGIHKVKSNYQRFRKPKDKTNEDA